MFIAIIKLNRKIDYDILRYNTVAAHELTEDLNRERLILLCLGIPSTLFWFVRFKGKRTSDKILSPSFVIVNQSYI